MTDPRICYNWPPDFVAVLERRSKFLAKLRADPYLKAATLKHYETHPVDFILDWGMTYDPRTKPTLMPFCLFPKQVEVIEFLHSCVLDQENGLIEKCRDAGMTWCCAAFSVWLWLFWPGAAVGFGSRKEDLVDKLGDPKCIFEKIRQIINYLPKDIFWPDGFSPKDHMTFMKVVNPANGASIAGEAGDNVGRGGRTLIYFKDESAHYQRPELIEAALGDNTNVQIDISSVNGLGNVFHRRRQSGLEWPEREPGRTRVFIFDWRDHPGKTQEWYNKRRAKAQQEGLLPEFSQEVDRDYASAVANVLIPGLWVSAAIDAHVKLGIEPSGARIAAMDVADDGGDVNALCVRHGIVVQHVEAEGGEADKIGRKYYVKAIAMRCAEWRYETAGVGAGARAGAAGVIEGNAGRKLPTVVGWSPSCAVVRPAACIHTGRVGGDVETRNRDYYYNGNAQAWWRLREAFRKTYLAVTGAEQFDQDELISLDSRMPLLAKLQAELSQPVYETTTAGKLKVDKQPAGTRSPNLADAVKICFAELAVRPAQPQAAIGGVGVAVPGVVAIG